MKLTDAQRAHLAELLRDRPQWYQDQIRREIEADEQDDNPRPGLSTYALISLENELGIM
jgi:hypothetical protein